MTETRSMVIFRFVGLLYLLSGIWCAMKPDLAAGFLGFQLTGTLGQAEFFSVYGGLQVGIAMAILLTSYIPAYRLAALFFTALFSLGLFSFRSMSFWLFDQSAVIAFMLCLEGFLTLILWGAWWGARERLVKSS